MNQENLASSDPFFIEVPTPITSMTPSEMDEFVEDILKALEGE